MADEVGRPGDGRGLDGDHRLAHPGLGRPEAGLELADAVDEALAVLQGGGGAHAVLGAGHLGELVEDPAGDAHGEPGVADGGEAHHAEVVHRAAPATDGGEEVEGGLLVDDHVPDGVVVAGRRLEAEHVPVAPQLHLLDGHEDEEEARIDALGLLGDRPCPHPGGVVDAGTELVVARDPVATVGRGRPRRWGRTGRPPGARRRRRPSRRSRRRPRRRRRRWSRRWPAGSSRPSRRPGRSRPARPSGPGGRAPSRRRPRGWRSRGARLRRWRRRSRPARARARCVRRCRRSG